MNIKKIPFLVVSSDKYADLWDSFLTTFKSNFKNRQKIYFASNTKKFKNSDVIPILSGPDKDWSSSLIKILDKINEEYLIIILEDLYFTQEIDKEKLNSIIKFCYKKKINYLRYFHFKKHNLVKNKKLISKLEKRIPFRATVCGIWKKKCLRSLLIAGESAWEFEIMGSYRARDLDKFYTVNNHFFKCKNMVEKGMWIPKSVKWAQNNNIKLNLKKRKYPSIYERFLMRIKKLCFEFIIQVPWRMRVSIVHFFRKILISY